MRWLTRRGLRLASWLWGLIVVGLVGITGFYALRPYAVGPAQPIPFSHRVHAGDKGISCLFCHDGADRSSNAGMPEVGKCLLCHNVIIPDFEPIQRLHKYYDTGEPVPWGRVYRVPDFAFFNHQMHIRRDVDCGTCHGDVKQMDRIIQNQVTDMGWCVNCHRKPEYEAPVDCWVCHR